MHSAQVAARTMQGNNNSISDVSNNNLLLQPSREQLEGGDDEIEGGNQNMGDFHISFSHMSKKVNRLPPLSNAPQIPSSGLINMPNSSLKGADKGAGEKYSQDLTQEQGTFEGEHDQRKNINDHETL